MQAKQKTSALQSLVGKRCDVTALLRRRRARSHRLKPPHGIVKCTIFLVVGMDVDFQVTANEADSGSITGRTVDGVPELGEEGSDGTEEDSNADHHRVNGESEPSAHHG